MKRFAVTVFCVFFGVLLLGIGVHQLRECVFPGAEAQASVVTLVLAGVAFGVAYRR